MKNVIMPQSDWQNILDSIRAKSGKTDKLVSSQVPAEIDNLGGVLEVKQLPTENINENAFYLYKGEYYKYKGNTWVFNDELTKETNLGCQINAQCVVDGEVQPVMYIGYASWGLNVEVLRFGGTSIDAIYYYAGAQELGWVHECYKTITIPELPNDEIFLSWLKANAKQQGWQKYIPNIPNAEEAKF